ncbi:MAG: DUF3955 domain-containing protein [Sarcina sp.]
MKKYKAALISFIIGLGCFIAYNIKGVKIGPNGILEESFFLIPIGELFIFIALIITIVVSLKTLFKKNKFKNI